MARVKVTVHVEVWPRPSQGETGGEWLVSDTETGESPTPGHYPAEVARCLGEVAGRVRDIVATRFPTGGSPL